MVSASDLLQHTYAGVIKPYLAQILPQRNRKKPTFAPRDITDPLSTPVGSKAHQSPHEYFYPRNTITAIIRLGSSRLVSEGEVRAFIRCTNANGLVVRAIHPPNARPTADSA